MGHKDESKSIGGKARAAALSPKKRKEIAAKAAIARWGAKSTHKGNFKEEFGIDVDCYVLQDESKTAVISQTGMARALGLSARGNAFPRFANSNVMQKYIGAELREKINNPLKFQWVSPGAEQPPLSVHGYEVTLLIDVCKAILAAADAGDLLARQKPMAKQAHIITNASAKHGITQLVYDLAGFDTIAEERIAAFKLFVIKEAREYEKEFPDELYKQWYRLYELQQPQRGRPWAFKTLTLDHVYWPLAKSNGKILELTRLQKSSSEKRHQKLHQFLSDIGVKALRQHLGQLLGIAQVSSNRDEYERNINKVFGEQHELDL
jgi:hypothetical protein